MIFFFDMRGVYQKKESGLLKEDYKSFKDLCSLWCLEKLTLSVVILFIVLHSFDVFG